MTTDLLVSPDWLFSQIKAGQSNLVIVDVSWSSTNDCFEEYKKCHIPGAQYINMLDADHTDLYPRNIPTPDKFTSLARQAGIGTNSHVVVYSNTQKASFFSSGRGWWTFNYFGHSKVSILDGGLNLWQKQSLPTTDEMQVPKSGDFVCNIDTNVYTSYDDVLHNTSAPSFQLVDTRVSEAFEKGKIPGAKNVPLDSLIDYEGGKLKSKQDIATVFQMAGVDLDQPVVTHCNSGMSSCAVMFAACLVGIKQTSLYHGGFTAWKKNQGTV